MFNGNFTPTGPNRYPVSAAIATGAALVAATLLTTLAAPAFGDAPTRSVDISFVGTTGEWTCPDGTTKPADFRLNAEKTKGEVTGNWDSLGAGFKAGTVDQGAINKNNFNLLGEVTSILYAPMLLPFL